MLLIKNFKNYSGFISIKNIVYILAITLMLFVIPDVQATELSTSAGSSDAALQERIELLSGVSFLIKMFTYVIGLVMLIKGGFLLKEIADQKTKVGFGGVAVVFISAIMIFSFTNTLASFVPTMLGESAGYCFAVDNSSVTDNKTNSVKDYGKDCWDVTKSDVTKAVHKKIEAMSSPSTAAQFVKSLNSIISLFQIIGSVYFIKGIYGLYETAMGTSREPGYGKPIITMIFSSFLVDLGHTLEMLLATLRAVGMNF